jgi:hypothetical protein
MIDSGRHEDELLQVSASGLIFRYPIRSTSKQKTKLSFRSKDLLEY